MANTTEPGENRQGRRTRSGPPPQRSGVPPKWGHEALHPDRRPRCRPHRLRPGAQRRALDGRHPPRRPRPARRRLLLHLGPGGRARGAGLPRRGLQRVRAALRRRARVAVRDVVRRCQGGAGLDPRQRRGAAHRPHEGGRRRLLRGRAPRLQPGDRGGGQAERPGRRLSRDPRGVRPAGGQGPDRRAQPRLGRHAAHLPVQHLRRHRRTHPQLGRPARRPGRARRAVRVPHLPAGSARPQPRDGGHREWPGSDGRALGGAVAPRIGALPPDGVR